MYKNNNKPNHSDRVVLMPAKWEAYSAQYYRCCSLIFRHPGKDNDMISKMVPDYMDGMIRIHYLSYLNNFTLLIRQMLRSRSLTFIIYDPHKFRFSKEFIFQRELSPHWYVRCHYQTPSLDLFPGLLIVPEQSV